MNYVYVITNNLNTKKYVGVTNNPERRWRDHKKIAIRQNSVRYAIHDAIAKYGEHNFEYKIIEQHEIRSDAFKAEEKYVRELKTLEEGYNLNSGGRGPIEFSEKTRKLISEAAKRRFSSPEERKRHGSFTKGVKKSQETKKRMSAAQIGRVQSESTRHKISESKIGKKVNFSEEHREYLRNQLKKITKSDAHRQRIIQMNHKRRGIPLSLERRVKVGKPIKQISLETGELLKVFLTMKEASNELKIPYHQINRCVKGKKPDAGGFLWVYVTT